MVVDVEWSGISTGTERLLWTGEMPPFPGMGYPLVPGYESVGRIAGGPRAGERVFVPGARCFGEVRGLFGGAASRLVVPGRARMPIGDALGERGVLLALAATAQHAMAGHALPDLIVGHGVLGRMLARLAVAARRRADRVGARPGARERRAAATPWSTRRARSAPRLPRDLRRERRRGHPRRAGRAPGARRRDRAGRVLQRAGPSFAFPPAFMREARIRIAAQWQPADLHRRPRPGRRRRRSISTA